MKFVDMTNITVIAGNGGNGCISFQKSGRRASFLKKPNGSNGGSGGDVWLLADPNINTLNYFHYNRVFRAGHGQSGRSRGCTGKRGKDFIVKVPWGTRVSCKKTNKLLGYMGIHQKQLMVAKGGLRGVGNGHIKSSVVSHKKICNTYGSTGESQHLLLELLLIANVGMFGLPNSGKSSFIRIISSAKPKVANYPFTTLIPYLGVVQINNYNRFVIADIPGIIKGASHGLGLGMRFLKHLEHCQMLLHFVDIAPSDDSDPLENIITIKNELSNYNKSLINKPCWLIFNKIDLLERYVAERRIHHIISSLKWKERYYSISSMYNTNVLSLCNNIMRFIVHHTQSQESTLIRTEDDE
ncbi:GTPase ObgE [Blochmannia endosymbiont of Camponotus sp. C-003]|uniref:GTPase ObgE n=1 Tax=unclassified Candidatus Blochmanniella TaxID=711328 RepID=UPI00202583E5|nr:MULTISPECIES: GTPase ObgE [unclassified Candidatus Blochmannia]URJ23139.1 GTPase ObgE [Blochmannia endosymbiont of Camponotus sp. C-003]URJ28608.1 GTPase ObgE [Blochmannia endosymbiont of Camponotus sp. C-046]